MMEAMTIKRKQELGFHIKNDDYFGTLATLLDLLRQEFKRKDSKINAERILKNLTDDLMYLQRNYKILEKDQL
jgi:hypothetical protein